MPEHGVIELGLRDAGQLFDDLDPSPSANQDLDPRVERYIVESFRELPSGTACRLVVHLDQPPSSETEIAAAIREHFVRQARLRRQELRRLIRRGVVSLAIGIAFLAAVFMISRLVVMGNRPLGPLIDQGLLIVGWVAMWRPLEIFLYDWWPILGERRMHDRLGRAKVSLVPRATAGPASTLS